MPDDIRIKRIEAFFLQELSRIVSRELKNPVFENKLISFPGIKVSRDLSIAHVSVTVLGDQTVLAVIVTALTAAESVIRREIREVCDLRKIPKFVFHEDRSMEQAAKIDKILDSLVIPPEEPPACEEVPEEEGEELEEEESEEPA